jgi:periplasmic copper chaperone A
MNTRQLIANLLLFAMVCAGTAQSQTKPAVVTDAWVRAVVPQQKATGAYFTIQLAQGGKLVSASTPAAAMAEIHEMRMEGDVMRMRELTDGLLLPKGQAVALKPGGFHIMLMGLAKPLTLGDTVPITLVIEGADKKRSTLEVRAVVRAQGEQAKH